MPLICLCGHGATSLSAQILRFWLVYDDGSGRLNTPSPCSDCREQQPPGQEQIRQGCQRIDLAAVLG